LNRSAIAAAGSEFRLSICVRRSLPLHRGWPALHSVDRDALVFFQALYLFLVGGSGGPVLRHCGLQLENVPL
jgi:hypothetical protein